MIGFTFKYFFKEMKKNVSMIGVVSSALLLLSLILNMFYNTVLNPPLNPNDLAAFFVGLLRFTIIMLFMLMCIYLVIYSINYYNKVHSRILGLLKIFGNTTYEIVIFFTLQIVIILLISFLVFTLLNIVVTPLLFKLISYYIKKTVTTILFGKAYLDTLAFFFLTILVIIFVEFRYIIQTPTTHLIKGDEVISYKIKSKNLFKEILYFLLLCYGLFIIVTSKLELDLVVPLSLCVIGINGIIKYTIPRIVQTVIQQNNMSGELLVVLKNYIFIINQMGVLVFLSVLINLVMPLMIYMYMNKVGFFLGFVMMYIFTNLILNYIIYQRLSIRRIDNKKSYTKLYTLGYDLKSIKKYTKIENTLFFLTLFIGIAIYFFTLSISLILKNAIPPTAIFVCLIYIIPMFVILVITNYKEGRSVLSWKKS